MAIADTLPPGPRLPRWAQTIGFILFGARFLEEVHRRFGDVATMQTLFDDRFVLVFSPELVRLVFQGPAEQLRAGEANALLGPIVGARSILLLDGEEHLRHRRLMSPPFHGTELRGWMDTMRACADAEIDRWPVGERFPVLPRMHDLTLRVMLRAVFGYGPGPAGDELAARLRAMIEPLSRRSGLLTVSAVVQNRRRSRAARRFAARTRAVDEVLFAEIARRRADPQLAGRADVFSALLRARGEDGVGLSDEEVRDELLTLLLAGHETTATGLAWALDLLLHEPRVLARARTAALDGDDAYLDAVVKEALRRRPVIPSIGRVVRGAPLRIGPYSIPEGIEVNPSIRVIHHRPDLFPEPERFLPERFLAADAPDSVSWLPFGGGTRRCLGASFAQTEMRIVLAQVLRRTALRAGDRRPAKAQLRTITLAPHSGVPVIQDRSPAPVTEA